MKGSVDKVLAQFYPVSLKISSVVGLFHSCWYRKRPHFVMPVYGVWKKSARSHACRVQALRAVRSRVCIPPVKTVKLPQSKTSCKKSIINQGFSTRGLTSFSSKCQHKKMLKLFHLVFFLPNISQRKD